MSEAKCLIATDDDEYRVLLPGVPRVGDEINLVESDGTNRYQVVLRVREVSWRMVADGPVWIRVDLEEREWEGFGDAPGRFQVPDGWTTAGRDSK